MHAAIALPFRMPVSPPERRAATNDRTRRQARTKSSHAGSAGIEGKLAPCNGKVPSMG